MPIHALSLLATVDATSFWHSSGAILSIVLLDLVLAGDNALVIALTVSKLPPRQRLIGTIIGTVAAVGLRIGLTLVAAKLLSVQGIQVAGGALVLWIAFKLARQPMVEGGGAKAASGLWNAVFLICAADVAMSVDNVLAVAAVSRGSLALLFFGLGLSIPLVVLASRFIGWLLDRYPLIAWAGVAVLGRVGAMMLCNDPLVVGWLAPGEWAVQTAGLVGAVAVVGLGLRARRRGMR